MGALQTRPIRVVREPHDGDVRPRVDDLLGLHARDVRDHEIGRVDAVGRHEAMTREEALQPASEKEIDPNEQDRRHAPTVALLADADNRAVSLERGLDLIRAEAYFEAHEELEEEWLDAPAGERDFLQGLVHVAVAWHHAGRGNRPGCERQLEKAARRLESYRPRHRGVDVESVLDQLAYARELVQTGSLSLPKPQV